MGRKIANLFGLAILALSLYLYFLYQGIESLPVGLASVALFGIGLHLSVRNVRSLAQFKKVMPFLVVGATACLALVSFGLDNYIASSYYGQSLAFVSVRLTAALLALGGVTVHVSSDVLEFQGGRALSIGPLCSGAYSTVLFLLLSVVMVVDVGREAPKKKLAIALIAGVLGANLANVFRITFLASVMYVFGTGTLDVVHQFAGYAVFLGFMAAFWLLTLGWLTKGKARVHPNAL